MCKRRTRATPRFRAPPARPMAAAHEMSCRQDARCRDGSRPPPGIAPATTTSGLGDLAPIRHSRGPIHDLSRSLGQPLVLLRLLLLSLLVLFVELRMLAYVYRKIGVHPRYVFAVLLLTLAGAT